MEPKVSRNNSIHLTECVGYAVEYAFFYAFLQLFKTVPLRASYSIAACLVTLLYKAIPKLRNRVEENINTCFGDCYSEREKQELYSRFLKYHAWFWVDMLVGPHVMQKSGIEENLDLSEALETISKTSRSSNTGVLLVSSHQGSPDLITLALGSRGFTLAAIARQLDNPFIRKKIANERKAFPRIELPKNGGLRPAFRQLSRNGMVGLQIDQDAGPNGLFISYFGKLASTHSGAGMLAVLADCPVIMVFAIRTAPSRFRYKLFAERLDPPADLGNTDANVLAWTRVMTESIERMARRYPEQVFWTHRRWKTRPLHTQEDADRSPGSCPPNRTSLQIPRFR